MVSHWPIFNTNVKLNKVLHYWFLLYWLLGILLKLSQCLGSTEILIPETNVHQLEKTLSPAAASVPGE